MNNPLFKDLIFDEKGTITTIIIDTATYTSLDKNGNPLPQVEEEDEFDSILAEPELVVFNLLEEEILLSLPIAPKHEAGACEANAALQGLKEEISPFAALANLKVVC
jgi:uncharacterized protein